MKRIEWTDTALRDMAELDQQIGRRVQQALRRKRRRRREKTARNQSAGVPLRVSDYRVRFDMEGEAIRVLRVLNRREAYR